MATSTFRGSADRLNRAGGGHCPRASPTRRSLLPLSSVDASAMRFVRAFQSMLLSHRKPCSRIFLVPVPSNALRLEAEGYSALHAQAATRPARPRSRCLEFRLVVALRPTATSTTRPVAHETMQLRSIRQPAQVVGVCTFPDFQWLTTGEVADKHPERPRPPHSRRRRRFVRPVTTRQAAHRRQKSPGCTSLAPWLWRRTRDQRHAATVATAASSTAPAPIAQPLTLRLRADAGSAMASLPPPVESHRSSSAMSLAVCQRVSGSLARHFRIRRSSPRGVSG